MMSLCNWDLRFKRWSLEVKGIATSNKKLLGTRSKKRWSLEVRGRRAGRCVCSAASAQRLLVDVWKR